MRAKILCDGDVIRYFDKNGVELHNGDTVVADDGSKKVLYLTTNGELGTDATNPLWVESGRAAPCEYGIYPLTEADLVELSKCSD